MEQSIHHQNIRPFYVLHISGVMKEVINVSNVSQQLAAAVGS